MGFDETDYYTDQDWQKELDPPEEVSKDDLRILELIKQERAKKQIIRRETEEYRASLPELQRLMEFLEMRKSFYEERLARPNIREKESADYLAGGLAAIQSVMDKINSKEGKIAFHELMQKAEAQKQLEKLNGNK